MKRSLTVPTLPAPERLDKFLIRQFPESGRNYWRTSLEASVRVNGKKASKGQLLRGGEVLELSEVPPETDAAIAANPLIPIQVLFENKHCFAIDKAAGLACHPLRRDEDKTVANAALARYPELAGLRPTREAGLVHRLDNETSGVLLFARDLESLKKLRALSRCGGMRKTYFALVEGRLTGSGEIDLAIGHHPGNTKKMRATSDASEAKRLKARAAKTRFECLANSESLSLIKLEIDVGARHQIRVHLAAIGHPILGDRLYGAQMGPSRFFLHAAELRFPSPWAEEEICISAAPPEDFLQAGASLEKPILKKQILPTSSAER